MSVHTTGGYLEVAVRLHYGGTLTPLEVLGRLQRAVAAEFHEELDFEGDLEVDITEHAGVCAPAFCGEAANGHPL